ncbi:MAG TPA: hypothetical protein VI584_00545 [Nitrospiria bacterium]|nr:hypothetical protein [Nitrospiria bacterium]
MLIGRYQLGTLFISAILLGLVFMGCGDSNIFDSMADDSTSEAKLEEGQIALDTGDYTKAIDIFSDLCGLDPADPASNLDNRTCDNSTVSLLASAYMGRSGLDLIALIDAAANSGQTTQVTLANAAETGQTEDQQSFTQFSTLFLDPNSNEADMQNAVAILAGIDISSADEDQSLLLAVAAAADTIMIIRDTIEIENFDPDTGLPTTVPSAGALVNAANEITPNIPLIIEGITGSGIADADLIADIDAIQEAIAGTDLTVGSDELHTYLCSLNPTAVGCP